MRLDWSEQKTRQPQSFTPISVMLLHKTFLLLVIERTKWIFCFFFFFVCLNIKQSNEFVESFKLSNLVWLTTFYCFLFVRCFGVVFPCSFKFFYFYFNILNILQQCFYLCGIVPHNMQCMFSFVVVFFLFIIFFLCLLHFIVQLIACVFLFFFFRCCFVALV